MYVNAAKYGKFDRHSNKVPTDEDEQEDYYKDKHVFTVDGNNEENKQSMRRMVATGMGVGSVCLRTLSNTTRHRRGNTF